MSWLGIVNKFVFQWFFFRLCKHVDGMCTYYSLLCWVLPLTGWWSDYGIINKNKKLKFYKLSEVKTRWIFLGVPVILYFTCIVLVIVVRECCIVDVPITLSILIILSVFMTLINSLVLAYTD